ncbi:117aa long hypothetical protein [Pyrococcus horikoshii OT3]|uniref:Uncharacterized protein n=1 Tax=Pyrococcus horikoshii (strain ATCC 700860 / DSM 12428 / JCM 9974 / NBRC 100139 / OT-3) TaxID=70601 RepID=O50115_PYRHO|nr:117aa long hypothetical protein [Pyrococcus horikoshii OT3]
MENFSLPPSPILSPEPVTTKTTLSPFSIIPFSTRLNRAGITTAEESSANIPSLASNFSPVIMSFSFTTTAVPPLSFIALITLDFITGFFTYNPRALVSLHSFFNPKISAAIGLHLSV